MAGPPARNVPTDVVELRYEVASARGAIGNRSLEVTFASGEGCQDVHVQVVAVSGSEMPVTAEGCVVLLDSTLTLEPRVVTTVSVEVPRTLEPPYWVRCFVVGEKARIIDPPPSSLRQT
jgi:hypothetical protein